MVYDALTMVYAAYTMVICNIREFFSRKIIKKKLKNNEHIFICINGIYKIRHRLDYLFGYLQVQNLPGRICDYFRVLIIDEYYITFFRKMLFAIGREWFLRKRPKRS